MTAIIVLIVLIICGTILIVRASKWLKNVDKEIKEERKKQGVDTYESETIFTYGTVKHLKGSSDFKEVGRGWLTFKWRQKYYLAYFKCSQISESVLVEISEEQYNGKN